MEQTDAIDGQWCRVGEQRAEARAVRRPCERERTARSHCAQKMDRPAATDERCVSVSRLQSQETAWRRQRCDARHADACVVRENIESPTRPGLLEVDTMLGVEL